MTGKFTSETTKAAELLAKIQRMTTTSQRLNYLEEATRGALSTFIITAMERWGYRRGTDPGYRKENQWWAGFAKEGNEPSYAWADTPEEAVRLAAIAAIRPKVENQE